MTISNTTQLETAIDGDYTVLLGSKATIVDAAGGQFFSFFRSSGLPTAAGTPAATPVVTTNTTTGAFNFPQQTSPRTSYIAEIAYSTSIAPTTLEIHDRLVHMGGLSGILTTTQTVTGFDLSTLAGTSNLDARKGDANYSDVQWWLEHYVEIGGTNTNATVNVTYNDGTTGNLTAFNVGNNDRRIGRMFPLNPLIPAADQGKYIRGINSLTLSASSGTGGNMGFVATRYRTSVLAEQINERHINGWTKTSFPEIYNSSCLCMIGLCTTTSTGTVRASIKIIHG